MFLINDYNLTSITLQLIIFSSILIWIYCYIRYRQSYWSKYNLPIPQSNLFGIGSEWELIFKIWSDLFINRMKTLGKLYGSYSFLQPVLYVYDPDLIKLILIKDFHCFTDRGQGRVYHKILNQNIFASQGSRWKRMRTISSPSFTSKKLRNISKMMNYCIEKLFKYFDKILLEKSNGGLIETKKVIAGFTMDVIAWSGFSTDTNSNTDDNLKREQNQFLKNGLGLFKSTKLRVILAFLLPRFLLNLLQIRTLAPEEHTEYFVNLIKEIIRQRKLIDPNNSRKPNNDLLQLMLDAEADKKEIEKNSFDNLAATIGSEQQQDEQANSTPSSSNNESKQKLTENEIIANSIIFMIAGFETTASTISHSLFLLAWHPNIQDKLVKELREALSGKINDLDSDDYYETIMQGIPYLEAIIKEVLRMYPPVTILNRTVTCDQYKLPNGIELKRGMKITIPSYAIHHCEDFYPEPEKFKPERWLPENRDKLIPYTWMPFGLGPRNCIGMRFAYQEIRLTLAQMLMRYRFEPTENTPKTLKFLPRSIVLLSKPFELRISKR